MTADALLPEDGELRLGSVQLPTGERVFVVGPQYPRQPVAWVTSGPVAEPGLTWSELSTIAPQTGLIPFIADSLPNHPRRPWRHGRYSDRGSPPDPTLADVFDVTGFLRRRWEDRAFVSDETEESTKRWTSEQTAPFGSDFPGLAPAATEPLGPDERQRLLAALPPASIGLAAASRPADALPATGWEPSDQYPDGIPMAAVLRSWEDRFGARLLRIGLHQFTVLAERPPRAPETVRKLAAEHWAFADECTCGETEGMVHVSEIASCLMKSPIWGFWWD